MRMSLSHRTPGRVTVQEAAEQTGRADIAVLLDCRETEEWRAAHAPWAVPLPLSALSAGAALPREARGRPVCVICRSGNRSREAAKLLLVRGAQVVDVIGGMREWARAGLPVVDDQGRDGTVT